ncbi:Pal1 cell morphology protein-domain-containing protein [Scheffersomyces xylosifermentans]|uniref:Pal1 cell morphology protein-domain-containing protein n=1 Tax=Scheffersomyces xylosifermentans TaxID=1304137 RepID=UPI00315D3DDD
MASNNPFAAALNEPDSYVHRRDPPPPPRQQLHSLDGSGSPKIHSVNLHTKSSTPPARPPKASSALPPPSYEEVAGPDGVRREYPREKVSSSSNGTSQTSASRHGHPHGSSGRPHRSHSDSGRPSRSSREKSSGRSGSSGSGTRHHHASSHHHKSSSSRNKSPSKKKPEAIKAKNLDTIDKLDVTAFFGSGFHHDGPFDACTPHRNKNAKSAPVAAFPVDGPNNSIAGLKGNVDKNEQMNLAFGTYEDGPQNEIVGRKQSVRRNGPVKDDFPTIKTRSTNDAAFTPKQNPSVINFDSNLKAEPIHGSTTAGLGSTTFVDGAPAPKIAEQNEYLSPSNGGGLNRKKSLVQRLRKNSNSENSSRRNSHETTLSAETGRRGSLNNFDSNDESKPQSGVGGGTSSLIKRVKSLKVRR